MAENNVNNSNENAGRNNAQLLPVQPRQPQNLQGLLRFAMEAREPDAPPVQELQPMDDDRRAFLARALEDMVTDAVVILRAGIPMLTDAAKIQELDGKEELTPEIRTVFESVLDIIEDLDVANDFCKLGGFDTFMLCYNTKNTELWVNTNNLLAGVCQNIPAAQSLALEQGLLNKQLELLRDPDTKNKDKFIYAMSCSAREYEPACQTLLSLGGCEVLAPLAGTQLEPRLQTKAACLLHHLLQHYPEAQERIAALNLPSLLAPALQAPLSSASEHLLLLLKTSVKTCPQILEQARAPGLGLKEALGKIVLTPGDALPGAFEEISSYSTEVLRLVFGRNVYDCSEEADR